MSLFQRLAAFDAFLGVPGQDVGSIEHKSCDGHLVSNCSLGLQWEEQHSAISQELLAIIFLNVLS